MFVVYGMYDVFNVYCTTRTTCVKYIYMGNLDFFGKRL